VGLIATIHKGTRSPQDAPQRHAKGAARVEARDASQATGTRQSATSSQGEPTQAAQPISRGAVAGGIEKTESRKSGRKIRA
jgi:hypothetical protein